MEIAPLTRHRSTSVLLLKTSLALYGGEYIVKQIITVNGNLSLPLREGRGGVQK
jgi:hypothetical protein